MTWSLWSCPEPEQSWAFPKRLGLSQRGLITIYYHFQKLIESPTTVRQKEERDIPGPWDNLEGKSCLAGSFLVLAALEGTYWACGAAPCEEELPCRFLFYPMILSWTGCILAAFNKSGAQKRTWSTAGQMLNYMSYLYFLWLKADCLRSWGRAEQQVRWWSNFNSR